MWELDPKEGWTLKNWCFQIVMLDNILESPLGSKENKPVNSKGNQPFQYSLEGRILKLKFQYFGHLMRNLTHWKRPWGWERLQAKGEAGSRGWDVWMASLTQWTWIWANSGRCWRTGRPGVLQSMGSQRVRHNWATELNQQST